MAKTRELIRRKKGVQNTQKITRTMELISTAKLKKLGNKIIQSRPYARELARLVQDLLGSGLVIDLAMERREVKKTLLLAIASNRGLCGAYNVKVVDGVCRFLDRQKEQGRDAKLHVIGKRAVSMFSYMGVDMEKQYTEMDDRTEFPELQKMAQSFMDMFLAHEVDEIYVAYTAFHSRSKQDLEITRLLPLSRPGSESGGESSSPFIFEPSPQAVLSQLAPLAVEMNLYQMFMEAITSEQAYRMRAMKNATDNADGMIKELTRMYNRARQTQITLELLDILGGAEAL